jgi:copper oxidase (laccase) domain-containing protein
VTGGTTSREETAALRDFPAMELADWGHRFGILAGITTRAHGYNLGLLTPEAASAVLARWQAFAASMRPQYPSIAVGLQVHGREVVIHERAPRGWLILEGVDGHVTRQPGQLLAVSVADCVPVYLAHPASGALALLHAGWRGVAGGILEAGLDALQRVARATPPEFVMHCGVAICESCYEVGPEVLAAVGGTGAAAPGLLDLRGMLALRARAAGVGEVSISPWCSAHHQDRFFSHRRSAGADGRMLAYLGRPVA